MFGFKKKKKDIEVGYIEISTAEVRPFVKKICEKFDKREVIFRPKELFENKYAEYVISNEPVVIWRIHIGGQWYIYTISNDKEIILELNGEEEYYIKSHITAYEKPILAEMRRNNLIIEESVIKQIENW